MPFDISKVKLKNRSLEGLLSVDFKYREINKQFLKREYLKDLKSIYEIILFNIERANDIYKRLYNQTELFERKSTLDFEFESWQELKKVKGKLMRYYNELLKTKRRIENEQNKMGIMGNKFN